MERGRLFFLFPIFLLTVFFGVQCLHIQVELSNISMNSEDPKQELVNEEFKHLFGSSEWIVLGIQSADALSPSSLKQQKDLEQKIQNLKGVARVESLHSLQQKQYPRFSFTSLEQWDKWITNTPLVHKRFISKDKKTALIHIQVEENAQLLPLLVADLRKLIEKSKGKERIYLSGLPVQKVDVATYVQADQNTIIPMTVVILGALLFAFFRSAMGVLLPLGITGCALIWTLGSYSLLGYSLNTVTSLMPPAILVLGVATTVHYYQHWMHFSQRGYRGYALLKEIYGRLFFPSLFTSLTTAVGLLTLVVSDIPAIRLFGLFTALGVGYVYLLILTALPCLLLFLPPLRHVARPLHSLQRKMYRGTIVLLRKGKVLSLLTLILTLLSVWGIAHIRNNTNLLHFLKTSAPLHRDSMALNEAMGGIDTVEFILQRKDGKALGLTESIDKLTTLDHKLSTLEGVVHTVSPADLLGPVPNALRTALVRTKSSDLQAFIEPSLEHMRVSVLVESMGSARAAPLVQNIVDTSQEVLGDLYDLRPCGSLLQMVTDSNRLVQNLVKSFSLALILIMALMGVWFRSWKAPWIALIPNLLPIIWVFGCMGLLSIDLSTGTAMIASVTMGIIVDDTIHYLSYFYRHYRGNAPLVLAKANHIIGQAVVVTSLSLAIGFSVGCLGQFMPTIYFSLMTGWTIMAALFCDLALLPLGLAYCYKKR